MKERAIGVLALGEGVPELVLKVIAAHIEGYLNLSTICLESLPLPVSCLDERRLQYDAGKLLQYLEAQRFDGCIKILAVLGDDLFVPIFTHVFGEARQGGGHALVSIHRLFQNESGTPCPEPLAYERAAKVALHETCHLFDLLHCRDQGCLMHFSDDLAALDVLPINFCPYCTQYINDACRRMGIGRKILF
ncbi:MAG: zinc metallopeptidase [Desulfosalsimonadaceae bacterium]